MWLMQYITNNSMSAPLAAKGEFSVNNSGAAAVSASEEHKNLAFCYPYGVYSLPPAGKRAVVLPLNDGEVSLGVLTDAAGLEAGEVMLCSSGGASLVLKNDGRVLINGREVGDD